MEETNGDTLWSICFHRLKQRRIDKVHRTLGWN